MTTCSSVDVLSPSAVIFAAILPVLLALAMVVSIIIVFGKAGLTPFGVNLPALIINLLCILCLWSINWPWILLIALSTYFVVTGVKSQRVHYVILAGVVAFAIFLGGIGMGALFVGSTPSTFPVLAGSPGGGSYQAFLGLQQNCASYYGTFWVDPNFTPYDSNSATGTTFNYYCSVGWLSAVYFFYVLIAVLYFVMLAFAMIDADWASFLGESRGAEGNRNGGGNGNGNTTNTTKGDAI